MDYIAVRASQEYLWPREVKEFLKVLLILIKMLFVLSSFPEDYECEVNAVYD